MSLLAAALVAAGMFWFFRRSRKNYLALPELPTQDFRVISDDVIVVVPARDEEANIARVVSSFPPGWVLVVDDGSEDKTAPIARENTAEVIHAPRLLPGQKGKPIACAAGAKATHSKWILFVDADTWYQPEFLASALDYAESEELDMLSVFPRRVAKSFWERVLLPYAFALYFCGVNARAVNDPKAPEALANGQCLLMRRVFYDFIGGHTAVAKSVIEDVDLARLAKRHKGRTRVVRGESVASVRMYTGFFEIWRGFSKNSFRFLEANPGTGVRVVLASMLALSWLPALAYLLWEGQWIAAGVFALVPALVLAPWYGGFFAGLLAPAAIYFFQPIAINGMLAGLFGRKVLWKGREV